MEAYKFYKKGILPMSGGWLNQAQPFIEAIRIIDIEVEEMHEQINKEQRK